MKIRPLTTSCGTVLMVSLTSAGLLGSSALPASAAEFQQTNLISDGVVPAKLIDPDLVNPWGIAGKPNEPVLAVGQRLGPRDALFNSAEQLVRRQSRILRERSPRHRRLSSSPTGQVFNEVAGGFVLKNGSPATFLFNSEDGAISGWNPALGSVGPVNGLIAVDNGNADPTKNAVYKGLAIDNADGWLYAANFRSNEIEMYDSSFGLAKTFTNSTLPAGYAPFDVQVLNGKLYVTFALEDAEKHDDVAGLGHGFVDVFNLDGTGEQRLVSGGALDSPWGLAIAPAGFGPFGGDLLVGNFGNGMINAYNATTGAWIGALDGTDGNPLAIDGLWGLRFGNGAAGGGSLNALYFTAGPNGESDGLFGSLTAVPEPSTWAMMLAGFAGLASAAYGRSRRSDAAAAWRKESSTSPWR